MRGPEEEAGVGGQSGVPQGGPGPTAREAVRRLRGPLAALSLGVGEASVPKAPSPRGGGISR